MDRGAWWATIHGVAKSGPQVSDISNIAEVKQTLSKYITLIRAIRKDSIYTSESAHVIATPSLQYPNGYNYASGLLGSVHLSNGLMSDARLSITLLELFGE